MRPWKVKAVSCFMVFVLLLQVFSNSDLFNKTYMLGAAEIKEASGLSLEVQDVPQNNQEVILQESMGSEKEASEAVKDEASNNEYINNDLNPYNFKFFLNDQDDEYIQKIRSDFYNSVANPEITYQFIEPEESLYIKTYINEDGASIEYSSLLDSAPNFPTQEQIQRALNPIIKSSPRTITVSPTSLNLKANRVGATIQSDITTSSADGIYSLHYDPLTLISTPLPGQGIYEGAQCSIKGYVPGLGDQFEVKAYMPGIYELQIVGKDQNDEIVAISAPITVTVTRDVTNVLLDPTNNTTLDVDETRNLRYTVDPTDASDKSVTWTSSNTSVATVDSVGNVKGISGGTSNITVRTTNGGFTATCSVTVNASVKTVSITPLNSIVNLDETLQLNATVLPAIAITKNLTWSSSAPTIATVNSIGLVSAIGVGNATIYATADDNGVMGECYISVIDPKVVSSITLTPESKTIPYRSQLQLTANVQPSTALNKNVTWESSNNDIATVDSNGLVTGLEAGEVFITATTEDGDFPAFSQINVSDPIVASSITINQENITLIQGESLALGVEVVPTNFYNGTLEWSGGDPNIATIDENGVITAIGSGTTVFKVTEPFSGITDTRSVKIITHAIGIAINPKSLNMFVGQERKLQSEVIPANTSNKVIS